MSLQWSQHSGSNCLPRLWKVFPTGNWCPAGQEDCLFVHRTAAVQGVSKAEPTDGMPLQEVTSQDESFMSDISSKIQERVMGKHTIQNTAIYWYSWGSEGQMMSSISLEPCFARVAPQLPMAYSPTLQTHRVLDAVKDIHVWCNHLPNGLYSHCRAR